MKMHHDEMWDVFINVYAKELQMAYMNPKQKNTIKRKQNIRMTIKRKTNEVGETMQTNFE